MLLPFDKWNDFKSYAAALPFDSSLPQHNSWHSHQSLCQKVYSNWAE